MIICAYVCGWSFPLEMSKRSKEVSRTGVEPVTDGYLESYYRYSPPLCQLSYHELLVSHE